MVIEYVQCIQIYEVFIEPDVNRFILLVALAPSIAGFALAFLTRTFPPEYQDEDAEDIRQRFRLTYVCTHALVPELYQIFYFLKIFLHLDSFAVFR